MLTNGYKKIYDVSRNANCVAGIGVPSLQADTPPKFGGFFVSVRTASPYGRSVQGVSERASVLERTGSCKPERQPARFTLLDWRRGGLNNTLYRRSNMRALPAVTSLVTTTSTTIFKYRPLESRILREFGTVEAFEKAVNLQIKPFLSGECPDLLMADARRASFALRLTDIEQDALFNPEIFFGGIRQEDSERIQQKYELITKKPAGGVSRDTSQRAEKSKRSDSMNELQIFSNPEFGEHQIIEIDGKYYVGATEVAKRLGYINPHDAIIRHCRGVVKHEGVSLTTNQYGATTKQTVEMNFIPEGDVYRLIAHSQLPSAEKFERWIFDEVLPAIRKTGAYNSRAVPEDDVSNLVQSILDAQKRTQKLEAKIALSAALDTATYKKNNLQKLYETRVPLQELVTLTGVSRTHLTRCARRAGWTKIGVRTLLDGAQILILLEALKTPSPANVISTLINRTP